MDTFERKEIKYLLSPGQYDRFQELAEGRLMPAEYPEAAVSSVYYDTPDDTLINRSLAGGTYKEKLRVRTYGSASAAAESPVFIEIKKKFKGITYKRRVRCTQAAADGFLSGMAYEQAIDAWPLPDAQEQAEARSRTSLQIAGEIAWMRDTYEDLRPKMRVSTHRLSFVGSDDPELRVTFDFATRWSQATSPMAPHSPGAADSWHAMFPGGECILEVKCCQAYPLWLVAVLGECGAHPQSVSKYGRAYQALMADAHATARLDERRRLSASPGRKPSDVLPAARQARTQRHAAITRPRRVSGLAGISAVMRSLVHSLTHKPAHAHR